jgi:hypothetical protein
MKSQLSLLFFVLISQIFVFGQANNNQNLVDPKGAIIIAGLEGQVSVINNLTNIPLPPEKVKPGGILFDGHTIKTGPASKIILLLTNGTITTLKPETSLNFKKFTQEKFDTSKTKLNELKGEPSKSTTIMDIEFGDLVVDVKKLDKESSFNIESPVGTAGIRGTVPAISVAKLPDGGFTQTTSMLRGEIAFTPKGGGLPTLLGPGQSLSTGIGPNGVALPMQMGRVSAAFLKSMQADVEAAGSKLGMSFEEFKQKKIDAENGSKDAPSEDELNDSDDSRKGASKGVGGDDDNGTQEAVALDKAGLIDLDNAEQVAKVETYVEVTGKASELYAEKKQADATAARRRVDGDETATEVSGIFLTNLVGNLDDVVDITETASGLGAKDGDVLNEVVDNADKAKDIIVVFQAAEELDSKDKETVGAVLRNAKSADKVAEVVKNADDDQVSAKRRADGSQSDSKTKKLGGMFKAIKKIDEVAQKKKADVEAAAAADKAALAESAAAKQAEAAAAAEAAAGELLAAQELANAEAEKLRLIAEANALTEKLANASNEDKAALQIQVDAANAIAEIAKEEAANKSAAEAAAKAAKEAALAKKTQEIDDAKTAFELAVTSIDSALNAEQVDTILIDYENTHSLLARDGLNLGSKALIRKSDIETPVVNSENVFTNLEAVSDLTATATDLEETAKVKAQAAGKSQAEIDAEVAAISAGFESVLQNADQANELKEMVDKSAEVTAAAVAAAALETAAAEEAATVAAIAVAAAQAELNAAGSVAEIEAAQAKIIEADLAQVAAKASQDKAAASTTASDAAPDVSNLLNNASKAKDLKTVVDSATGAGAGDSLSALLKNPDQADKFAEVVKESSQSTGSTDSKSSTLKTLFNVVIKVDEAKDSQKAAAAEVATANAEKARLAAESAALAKQLESASADERIALELQAAAAVVASAAADVAAAEKVALAETANSIKVEDAFNQIADVVDLAESATELSGGNENSNFFDSVLANADQASELNAMIKKADELAAEEAATAAAAQAAAEAAEANAAVALAQAVTPEAKARAEAASTAAAEAKAAAQAKVAEATASKASRSGKLFTNASQAKDLKEMVDKADDLAAAETAAAEQAKIAAQVSIAAAEAELANATSEADIAAAQANAAAAAVAAAAAAEAEVAASASKSSRAGMLFENADQAADLKLMVDKAEAAAAAESAAAEQAALAAELANAAAAAELASATSDVEIAAAQAKVAEAAAAEAAAAAAKIAASATKSSGAGNLFDNADKVSDIKAVVAAAEKEKDRLSASAALLNEQLNNASESEKASIQVQVDEANAAAKAAVAAAFNTVSAVVANADQAKAMKSAVDSASGTEGGNVDSDQNLKTLFAVVEKVNDSKKAAALTGTTGGSSATSESTAAFDNLQALVDVAATLSSSTAGGDVEINLGAGFDAVLKNAAGAEQLASALKEDSSLLEKLSSATSTEDGGPVFDLEAEVSKSALGNLESRFAGNSEQIAAINEYKDRAEDLAFVLNSETVKGNAEMEANFLSNLDKLDNLLDLAKVLEDDTAKIQAVFQNLEKSDDLKALTSQFRYDGDKLNIVFDQLDKIDDIKSLSTTYSDDPEKLDAIFANTDKLEGIKNLSADLASNEMDTVFGNLDYLSEIQNITSRYEGEERTSVLENLNSLTRRFDDDPAKKEILFDNPDKLSAIQTLTASLDDEDGFNVIFSNIDKSDAILSTYNDIQELPDDQKGTYLTNLFKDQDSFDSTMKEQGKLKLNLEFPTYGEEIEQYGDRAAEIAITAELFKGNEEELDILFRNLDSLDLIREADTLGAKGSEILQNIDDLKALKADGDISPTLQSKFLSNPNEVGHILDIKNEAVGLGADVTDIFANLDDLKALKADTDFTPEFELEFLKDPSKIANALQVKDDAKVAGANMNDVLINITDLVELNSDFQGDATKMATVFANPDKADELKRLNDQFEGQGDTLLANMDKLDDFEELATDFQGDATKMATVFANPDKADELNRLNDQFEGQGDVLLANLDKLDDFEELASDFQGDATKMATVFANPEKADELKRLNDQFEGQGDTFLANLDMLDDFEELASDFEGDATKMATVFANPDKADELKRLNELHPGKEDLFLGNLDSLDILEGDSDYIDLLETDADFFKDIMDLDPEMKNLPPALLTELKALGLSSEELAIVVADLIKGPSTNDPTTTPPSTDPSAQSNSLSLLQDHTFTGVIDANLIMSKEKAMTSSFFSDASDAFDGLTALDQQSESELDPMTGTNVLGGRNLSFSSGTYQLDSSLIFASTDKLSLYGELVFGNANTNELILISAGLIEIESGTSLSYQADSLGMGSFDSLNIIDVDLHAEGEISLRSLDNIVITNSEMQTSNNGGADFIHLLAANELTIDNLRFSEQVRKIAMEAMTINLSNLNFPSGSSIELNSQYGGVDGKYPNFGSKLYGRVNFIENIRYNSNLMNSRGTFDQFGSSISIGTLK